MATVRGLSVLSISILAACGGVLACGGSTVAISEWNDVGDAAPSNGSDGGGVDAARPDASTSADGGPSGCPTALPTDGDPCTPPPAMSSFGVGVCEYGGTGSLLLCSTRAECSASSGSTTGAWKVTPPDASCVPTQAKNPVGCPAAFGDVAQNAACPIDGKSCVYPEGMCACESCFDPSDAGGQSQLKEWRCDAFPTPSTGCPTPRPALGTPCTGNGVACLYGQACESALPFSSESCLGGVWVEQAVGVDCAQLQCGN